MIRTCIWVLLASLTGVFLSGPASAVDKYTVGKVGAILINSGGDIAFHLEGFPALCGTVSDPGGSGKDWVTITTYMDEETRRLFHSILTSAKLSGRSIEVRGLNNNTPGEWGCRIERIMIL
jgi:hypothetical protein